MIIKTARFKVRKDKLQECLLAIGGFVEAVRAKEPDTLLYEAYQLPDKVSFMHLMKFKDSAAEEYHRNTEHVKKFVAILYPNCEEEPVFTDLKTI